MADVLERVLQRLRSTLPGAESVGATDRLTGRIDSMAVFELVGFIEREFQIKLADDDLVAANFESAQTLAELIARRLPARQ